MLESAIAPFSPEPYEWRKADFPSGLEDVFIHLMDQSRGQFRRMKLLATSILVLERAARRTGREGIHADAPRPPDLRHDARLIPLIQLTLFGFAINSDPRHLPAAILLADRGPQGRTLLHAFKNSTYFDFTRQVSSPKTRRATICSPRVRVQFVINIPVNFSRDLLRGDRPILLVEADATDPAATGFALGSLEAHPASTARWSTISKARWIFSTPWPRAPSTCASTPCTTPRSTRSTTSSPVSWA